MRMTTSVRSGVALEEDEASSGVAGVLELTI